MLPTKLTAEILAAAIEGFEVQKQRIDAQIAELRSMLEGGRPESAATPETIKPRKKRSAAVRRRMAMAQRARYAKLKQSSELPQAEAPKPKRKLSAAGRRAIIAATKKRWAAVKAAKQADKPAVAKKAGRKKATAKEAA
jgi:hypothetical protein